MKFRASLGVFVFMSACGNASAPPRDLAAPPSVPAAPALPDAFSRERGDAAPAADQAAHPALQDAFGNPPPATASATPPAIAAGEPLSALERVYVGEHALGVNRVTDMRRTGSVRIRKQDGVLALEGSVAQGKHSLALSGTVEPVSPKRFYLTGQLSGVPDMAWADEAPRARETHGRFLFEVSKGRKFWRLYEIDGRECVCNDGCGNDFCYIDIETALR